MLRSENLQNPAYFSGYDDRLRYGQQRVEEYKNGSTAAKVTDTEQNPEPKAESAADRTAPRAKPLREIPYTAEDTAAMLEQTPPPTEQPEQNTPQQEQPTQPAAPVQNTDADADTVPHKLPDGLTDEQIFVLSMIRQGMSFDEMCKCGIKAAHLLVDITYLELVGCIRALPGGRYEQI